VYSPQYGLWLLPWFALTMPDIKPFIAFELADAAVFVTRFWFFAELQGGSGSPQWLFEWMVVARALVLVWAVSSWLTRDAPGLVLGSGGWRAERRLAEAVPA
jgi:hypothetical protein